MRNRVMPRALAAMFLIAASTAALAAGCGDDDSPAGEGCSDPDRDVADGSLQFNDPCCGDAECADGRCASFNNKGDRCSKPCTGDADCAGLGKEKCGGQGVCALPD